MDKAVLDLAAAADRPATASRTGFTHPSLKGTELLFPLVRMDHWPPTGSIEAHVIDVFLPAAN